jgi:uncharacterized membrane protein YjfL (UPF0719 family)
MLSIEKTAFASLIWLGKILLSILLATFTIFFSLQLFNKTTKKIDELEEIKKGNTSVAIVLIAMILAIASIVQQGIQNITLLLSPNVPMEIMLINAVISMIQLLVSILVAIFVIKIGIYTVGKIYKGLDYEIQLKKGNNAVALLIAGVIIAISFVISAGVAAVQTIFF